MATMQSGPPDTAGHRQPQAITKALRLSKIATEFSEYISRDVSGFPIAEK